MRMKKTILIQILVLITLTSFGQKTGIDLKEIKSIANTDTYKKLLDRFISNDTTLSSDEYKVLYYGQAFQENYRPNSRHDSIRALNMYLNKGINSIDFNKVLNFTAQILKDFPFNIEQIYITGVIYDKLGGQDLSRLWFYKYSNLIKTILSSGDGKKPESAYIVTKITDEYSLLNALKLNVEKQSLIAKKEKWYDLMSLEKNQYGIENVYFDINLFFGDRK
jgi:hypothetical protein